MIAIVNVDTIPRSSGPHIYELRINKEVIATFTHNREDSLEKCLQLASQAAACRNLRTGKNNESIFSNENI